MSSVYPKYKVAAVQTAPVFCNLDATVEKTCALIDEAAANGAKLIAFPESLIPGYPWYMYIGNPDYCAEWYKKTYLNSVEIPGKAVQAIADACRRNRVWVNVSVNEIDGGSLYLTQLWFNPKGDLVGKHRKVKPTSGERFIWGDGDGSTLTVLETELGNLGSLQCWEHHVPGNVAAMGALNEQVHVSAWPAFAPPMDHKFPANQNFNAVRYYAMSNGCWVIMTSQPYTQEMHDLMVTEDYYADPCPIGAEGTLTCILNPNGTIVSRVPEGQEEGICYAEVDVEQTIYNKYWLDTSGHFSAPGALRLNVNLNPQPVVNKIGASDWEPIPYEALHEDVAE